MAQEGKLRWRPVVLTAVYLQAEHVGSLSAAAWTELMQACLTQQRMQEKQLGAADILPNGKGASQHVTQPTQPDSQPESWPEAPPSRDPRQFPPPPAAAAAAATAPSGAKPQQAQQQAEPQKHKLWVPQLLLEARGIPGKELTKVRSPPLECPFCAGPVHATALQQHACAVAWNSLHSH